MHIRVTPVCALCACVCGPVSEGNALWSTPVPGSPSAPVLDADGVLYIGTYGGIVALESAEGNQVRPRAVSDRELW